MLRPARRAALIATGAAWCMSSVAGGAALQPRISQDKGRGGMITIQPADDAQHTATVIGPLHGLGDSNMGWVDMAKHWHTTTCGHVKFILPNAPTSPVTINGGMAMPSWFDITSLEADEASQACEGMAASEQTVVQIIEDEVAAGIPLDRIVVGGFSQGGAVSLSAGLQYPGRLAGVLCISGWFANRDAFRLAPEAAATPVGHFHGDADPTVRVAWARQSAEALQGKGVESYELREYQGIGHGVDMDEIADIGRWIVDRLPPKTA